MKKFILVALLFSVITNAQNNQQAKNLLDEVTAKIKSYKNIVIDFKYALNNTKENINQESKGDVSLSGDLFHLNIMGITKIFDGKKNYTISPEDEEITISSHDEDADDSITPSKMLSFFTKGFNYEWDIQQNINGRKIQYIKLVAISSKDQRKSILLGIDTQTKHIYNLIEIGRNGTKTTLTINSFKVNQPLSSTLFTFNKSKYPNYYINKLD